MSSIVRSIMDQGVMLGIEARPDPHPDLRGVVRETYRESWFPGVPPVKQLVQSNSKAETLRGMHLHRLQWDVWRFVSDSAEVRLYDHRTGAQAFVTGDKNNIIAIPPGISHGFYTKTGCILVYALTREFDGTDEYGWYPFDGPEIQPVSLGGALAVGRGYQWPKDHAGLVMSERDLRATRLADFTG